MYEGVPAGLAMRTWPLQTLVVLVDLPVVLDALSICNSLFDASDNSYPSIDRIEMHVGIEIRAAIKEEREERSRTSRAVGSVRVEIGSSRGVC